MRVASFTILLAALLGGGHAALGQTQSSSVDDASAIRASLLYDTHGDDTRPGNQAGARRSPPLAFGMSVVLPGTGQAYNRQWIKAGVAVAIEAALITGYAVWRNRGLDGESAFRETAHESWEPVKYANWINDYTTFLEDEHGASVTAPAVQTPGAIDFTNPGIWTADEAAVVNTFFNQIRAVERELFHPETNASFSHQLPFFGEQQYYELIGKYFQFAPGWSDYPDWLSAGAYTDAIDPERSDENGTKLSVSDSFYQYARDHAHAQDLLRRARQVTSLLVVNHLAAAIDAVVSSKLHNDRLQTSVALVHDGRGGLRPAARLRVSI